MKRVRERIFSPNTIARCSLLSLLLLYRCKNISGPWVVGIRALAMHLTMGRSVSVSVLWVKGAAVWNVTASPVMVFFFFFFFFLCVVLDMWVLVFFSLGVEEEERKKEYQ